MTLSIHVIFGLSLLLILYTFALRVETPYVSCVEYVLTVVFLRFDEKNNVFVLYNVVNFSNAFPFECSYSFFLIHCRRPCYTAIGDYWPDLEQSG